MNEFQERLYNVIDETDIQNRDELKDSLKRAIEYLEAKTRVDNMRGKFTPRQLKARESRKRKKVAKSERPQIQPKMNPATADEIQRLENSQDA